MKGETREMERVDMPRGGECPLVCGTSLVEKFLDLLTKRDRNKMFGRSA